MPRYHALLLCLFCSAFHVTAHAETTDVALQLNWMFQFEFAGPIAAKEKGFYREAGINVEFRAGGPAIDPVTPVAEGDADFGISGSSLVVDRFQDKPVVALASLMQHSAVGLLARKSAGINSVNDLVGKKLAITFDTAVELDAYLKSQGIVAEDYQRIEHFVPLEDLDKGAADAIAVYTSNELYHIQSRPDEYMLFSPRSSGIDLFGNILFTNESMIKSHPELVAAFRDATIKGWDYALKNQQEVARIIHEKYNPQNKTLSHLLFEANKLNELTRPDIVEPGHMYPGRWRHVVDIYREMGKITGDIDLGEFIYDPDPQVDLTRFYIIFGVTLLALLAVIAVAMKFRRMNSALLVAEAELRSHQESLEEQVRIRTQELADAKNEAVRANEAKSQFLANMSHELRTPMHAIASFTSLSLKRIEDDKIRKYLENIKVSSNRLTGLLNALLDLSKMEAGKIELDVRKSDLAGIAAQCCTEVESLCLEKSLKIEMHSQDVCEGEFDPDLISQVIINLLSNAIKFSPVGGIIGLKVEKIPPMEEFSGTLELSVSDGGAGIPPEELDKIFEKFEQSSITATKAGGTGLGLSISREIINDHDGLIWAESPARGTDHGAEIHFIIPLTNSAAAKNPQ